MDETVIRRNARFMSNYVSKLVLCTMVTLLCLAGCSDADGAVRVSPTEQAREFSAEDKIAARSLSIGSGTTVAANTPYAKALLCRHGIEVIADRFSQSIVPTEEQQQSLRQVQAYYDRRLSALAAEEGKTASDIRRDLQQTAENNPDTSSNAKTMIACLRELQQTG